jgi:hypothetical protein
LTRGTTPFECQSKSLFSRPGELVGQPLWPSRPSLPLADAGVFGCFFIAHWASLMLSTRSASCSSASGSGRIGSGTPSGITDIRVGNPCCLLSSVSFHPIARSMRQSGPVLSQIGRWYPGGRSSRCHPRGARSTAHQLFGLPRRYEPAPSDLDRRKVARSHHSIQQTAAEARRNFNFCKAPAQSRY